MPSAREQLLHTIITYNSAAMMILVSTSPDGCSSFDRHLQDVITKTAIIHFTIEKLKRALSQTVHHATGCRFWETKFHILTSQFYHSVRSLYAYT